MTELKLYQLQKLIDKIDGLEIFLKRTFNKKNKLKMCTTRLFVDDVVLELADYPEMTEELCTVIRKHLNLMKQALEEA